MLVAAVAAAAWATGVSVLVALALVALGAGTAALAKFMFELASDVRSLRSTVDDDRARAAKARRVQADRLDRLAKARNRQRSQIAELRADVDCLDLLSERVERLAGGLAELRSDVAALAPLSDRIDVSAGELEKSARERAVMADPVADALQTMRNIVANERRSRALDLARQRSSGVMPQRLLLRSAPAFSSNPDASLTRLTKLLRDAQVAVHGRVARFDALERCSGAAVRVRSFLQLASGPATRASVEAITMACGLRADSKPGVREDCRGGF